VRAVEEYKTRLGHVTLLMLPGGHGSGAEGDTGGASDDHVMEEIRRRYNESTISSIVVEADGPVASDDALSLQVPYP